MVKGTEELEKEREKTNIDEARKLLKYLYIAWKNIDGRKPFYFWDTVIDPGPTKVPDGDPDKDRKGYAKTVENIFLLSYLINDGAVVVWVRIIQTLVQLYQIFTGQ